MSMPETPARDGRPEYDFSRGVRGKYADQSADGSNVVVLEPDVAAAFPMTASVHAALRAHLEAERRRSGG